MSRGLAYDSDEGRNYAAALTAIMHGEAYRQSAEIARDHGGPFQGYPVNREPFLKVIAKHRDAAYRIPTNGVPKTMLKEATVVFDEALALGEQVGYRNAQVTVLAPTGTIAFMMDCDTTGVEPDIALIKYKKLVGEGFLKIVNQTVPAALRKLGYGAEEVDEILAYLTEHETIEGAPHLKPQHLPVFDCAFKPANGERSIHYMGHVRMMGAIQPFISGAISKTVNMPEAATAEEIEKVYLEGWKLGLKAIAVYRDNSKRSQPLSTGKKTGESGADAIDTEEVEKLRKQLARAQAEAALPHRRRLPAERSAVTHKFDIAGHEGYITVGLYPDGQPGEIFLKMAKEGSTVSGLMDTFATTVSLALQYGVPLKDLVNKFAHVRFEPSGFTGNQEIPIAKSIVDYIFRWLGSRFLSPEDKANLGLQERVSGDEAPAATPFAFSGGTTGSASSSTAEPEPAPAVSAPEPKTTESDTPKATAVAAEPAVPAAEPLAVIATNGSLGNGHAANGNGKTTKGTVAAPRPRSPSTSAPPRSASRPRPTPPAAWTAARSWSATGPATSASTAAAPAAAARRSFQTWKGADQSVGSFWYPVARSRLTSPAHRTDLLEHRQPVGDAPVLDHAAVGDAHDVHDGDVDRAAGRRAAPQRAVIGAGRTDAEPHGVARGRAVLDLEVQVRELAAQLGDERTQAIDTGGRAFLVFDDVVGDESLETVEVAVVEAALDDGSADLLVRDGRGRFGGHGSEPHYWSDTLVDTGVIL